MSVFIRKISVKNLYADAMTDPGLSKYLQNLDQLSGKLAERDFFFGILCTLKQQYMKDIIAEANKERFKAEDDGGKKAAISLSDTWLQELLKYPYHSRKPGLVVFKLSKRLDAEEQKDDQNMLDPGAPDNRKKVGPSLSVHPYVGGVGKIQIVSAGPK